MCNEEAICERLLTAAGHQGPFKLTPIVGGRNNRVSRVQRGEHSFLLKSFFHSADDPRDRYGAETRFYDFVDRNQIAQTPKLAATSHNDKAILMEFIEGSRVRPEDIGPNEFRAAFDFAMALNSNVSGVSELSAASEACFSYQPIASSWTTELRGWPTSRQTPLPSNSFIKSSFRNGPPPGNNYVPLILETPISIS